MATNEQCNPERPTQSGTDNASTNDRSWLRCSFAVALFDRGCIARWRFCCSFAVVLFVRVCAVRGQVSFWAGAAADARPRRPWQMKKLSPLKPETDGFSEDRRFESEAVFLVQRRKRYLPDKQNREVPLAKISSSLMNKQVSSEDSTQLAR